MFTCYTRKYRLWFVCAGTICKFGPFTVVRARICNAKISNLNGETMVHGIVRWCSARAYNAMLSLTLSLSHCRAHSLIYSISASRSLYLALTRSVMCVISGVNIHCFLSGIFDPLQFRTCAQTEKRNGKSRAVSVCDVYTIYTFPCSRMNI